jgi:hypothetical protein
MPGFLFVPFSCPGKIRKLAFVFADSCDCEEFGLPLSKKINRLQLEQQVK